MFGAYNFSKSFSSYKITAYISSDKISMKFC